MRWSVPGGLVCVWCLGIGGCAAAPERFQFTRVTMGVATTVTLEAPDRETAVAAAAAAFDRIEAVEQAASDYRPSSEAARFCRDAPRGQWVPVSGDLATLLRSAHSVAQASDGALDVTLGPVVKLWREARDARALPNPVRLAQARAHTGWYLIEVDSLLPAARVIAGGLALDFGAVAKGYAAQQAVNTLRARGLSRCLVALAGDVCAGDPPHGQPGWTVEVRGERSARPLGRLLIRNACVSTSGDTEQALQIDGVRYSHVIDPRTGLGVVNGRAVTAVGENGAIVDAASTAAVAAGERGWERLARCGVTLIVHGPGGPRTIGDQARIRWSD